MLCVEMIQRFIDYNYDIIIDRDDNRKSDNCNDDKTSSRGPTVLYCAPSNKAVNVGACMLAVQNIYDQIVRSLSNLWPISAIAS